MMNQFPNLPLIEQFLDGHLNSSEQKVFEEKLANDADFQNEYAAYLELAQLIRQLEPNPILAKIDEVHNKLNAEGFFLAEEEIMDYLAGLSNPAESAIMEQRIRTDETFAQLVGE
ncbi:MAG: hypothetical protein AAGJ18_31325, partial [Bacteroidota bacterium]